MGAKPKQGYLDGFHGDLADAPGDWQISASGVLMLDGQRHSRGLLSPHEVGQRQKREREVEGSKLRHLFPRTGKRLGTEKCQNLLLGATNLEI